MAAKLAVVTGNGDGKVFALPENGKVTIGRGDAANVRIEDPTMSRVHCTIEQGGGKVILKDNGSSTGTQVNGKVITAAHALRPGEIITLGATKLRFQVDGATGQTSAEAGAPEELRKLKGSKLGHYQLEEVLAVGDSGVVFKASDLKANREVALKVYVKEFAQNEEDLQRFIRAVKTMLPMRHPNLVTLFGGGKTGPYCWMAMEYVEGECLTETIARIGKKGKLDWRPALSVARALASGLYYLHNEKIIHRSLSPNNILFSRLGTAKLGSLILAKALSGALARDVTNAGELLGDVRYQAPEQVGGGGSVDGRADIYSLGALVYALLIGRPPFDGMTPLETAQKVLQRLPIPPRNINPEIPEKLEAIVLRCMAKDAADRFQSAADLLGELESLPKV